MISLNLAGECFRVHRDWLRDSEVSDVFHVKSDLFEKTGTAV